MRQYTYDRFVDDHRAALEAGAVPECYWHALHTKLTEKKYDVDSHFELGQINYSNEISTEEEEEKEYFLALKSETIDLDDHDNIFLIDHALTFENEKIRSILESNEQLLARFNKMMCINVEGLDKTKILDLTTNKLWKFTHMYQVFAPSGENGDGPLVKNNVWYVMDEVGSSIQHSTTPNVRVASLMYAPDKLCYSFFWPISEIKKEDAITADWLLGIEDEERKECLSLVWEDIDFSMVKSSHEKIFCDEFFMSHRTTETEPIVDAPNVTTLSTPLKVFTDISLVCHYLTSSSYQLTNDQAEADILWLTAHFYDYKKLSQEIAPSRMVNQFPNESILTVKDLLAAIASSPKAIALSGPGNAFDIVDEDEIEDCPSPKALTCSWYPITFNLLYELTQFVAFYQRREKEENENKKQTEETDDCPHPKCLRRCKNPATAKESNKYEHVFKPKGNQNLWIVKPWNMGRGLGIFVTANLSQILRSIFSCPMIASRYLTDPVLFYRKDISSWVKFDIRYVVMLSSVKPLELYAHKVFWLRFANKEFSLNNLHDYAKHFTVMNYREDKLKQVHAKEFVELFSKQYPNIDWKNVEAKIHTVLVDIFKVASAEPVPRGLGDCKQSRAMYAVDLLLEWQKDTSSESDSCYQIQPQVCEVNFSPDCNRACEFHPDFYNHTFDCLFLGKKDCDDVIQLA